MFFQDAKKQNVLILDSRASGELSMAYRVLSLDLIPN